MPITGSDDPAKEQPRDDRDDLPEIIRRDITDLPPYDIVAELPGNDPTPGRRKPANG